MKIVILLSVVLFTAISFGQEEGITETSIEVKTKKEKKPKKIKSRIKLANALVIGQMNNPDDRYSIEMAMTQMLRSANIQTEPSLNLLKLGSDSRVLATDSLLEVVKQKGLDTYMLISVCGFDRKYRPGNLDDNFSKSLDQATFFDLYRLDAVSVSFQIKFFREGKCVHAEIIKCGNIADRGGVVKRFRKKVAKRLKKKW
tara:strand:+ start:488 stop:1087 length:600 start_codon:yes stop_codon:yes gene_type:complete